MELFYIEVGTFLEGLAAAMAGEKGEKTEEELKALHLQEKQGASNVRIRKIYGKLVMGE